MAWDLSLTYRYDSGDRYRVDLRGDVSTWTVLSGDLAGETGSQPFDAVEVAPDVIFVSWLEETAEIVSFVADLANKTIQTSYVYERDRYWWHGVIEEIERGV